MSVTLATAMDAIMDNTISALNAARQPVGEVPGVLADVRQVVRGDRNEPAPVCPAIWVFCKTAEPSHSTMNISEEWEIPVVFACLVENEGSDAGYQAATDLAARTRGVIVLNATKNLGLAYVRSITSGPFEPSAPWHRTGNQYRAYATCKVTAIIRC